MNLFSVIQLEKEAIVKGVPIGQSLDIEIPPPRPKRKPNNPYPRKTSVGIPAYQVEVKDGKLPNPVFSSCQSKVTVATEKESEVWAIHYASSVTFHSSGFYIALYNLPAIVISVQFLLYLVLARNYSDLKFTFFFC